MRIIIVIAFVTLTEAFLSCSDFCKLHGFKQIEGTAECLCAIEDIVKKQHFDYSSSIFEPDEEYYPHKNSIYMEPLYFRNPFYPSQNENKPVLENLKRPKKPSNLILDSNNYSRKHESLIHPLITKNKTVPFYLDIAIDETILNSRFGGPVTIDNPQILEQELIDCINLHILVEIRERNVDSNKSIRGNQGIHKYFNFSDSQLMFAIQNKCTQPVEIFKASLEEIKNKTPRRSFDNFFHSEQETKSNLKYINDADGNLNSGKKTNLSSAGHNVAKKTQSIGKDKFGITTPHIAPFVESNNSFKVTQSHYENTVTPSTTQEGIWTKMFTNQTDKDDRFLYTKTFDSVTASLGTQLPEFKEITNFTETKLNPTNIESLTSLTTPHLVNKTNTTKFLGGDLVKYSLKEFKSDMEIINTTLDFATKTNNKDSDISMETILDISLPYEQTEKPISLNDTAQYVGIFQKNNTELLRNLNPSPLFSLSDSIVTEENPITYSVEGTEANYRHFHQDEFLVHNLIKLEYTITTIKTADMEDNHITNHSSADNKSVEKTIPTSTPSKYDELVENKHDHTSFLSRGVTRHHTAGISPLEPSKVIRENQADANLIEDRSFPTTRNSELEPDLHGKILNNEESTFEPASTTRRAESELVKQTIDGELNFIFRGFSIPARFVQNSDGKIKVGIDGENLCDKIIENGLNGSIIISVLCKCLKANNCNDSLFSDNN